MSEQNDCPVSTCDKKLGDDHWVGKPNGNSHVYHTNNRRIARIWEHKDGIEVEPSTEPIGSDENIILDLSE